MAISWSCVCGKRFDVEGNYAGAEIVCSECGKINVVPAAPALPQKKAAPPPSVPLSSAEPPVVPEVEPIEDDDEIPEVDVEEHVPEWDKVKPKPEPKKAKAVIDVSDPFEVPEQEAEDVDEDEAKFTKKQASAGTNAWQPIGSIKLTSVADCIAYGPGSAYGLAGQDDDVLVINLLKGKKLDRFGGHDGAVTCLAMSVAGDFAVSGDDEGDVIYWEIPTRKIRRRLRDHESRVLTVAICPNGDFAVSGDREGGTRLWHLGSGDDDPLADSDWPEKITAVAFSSDNKLVAAGGSRGRVAVWSVKKGTALQRFRLKSPPICSLQFGPKNDTLIAATKPEELITPVPPIVWRLDLTNGRAHECFRPAEAPRSIPYYTTLDQGGRRLIVVGRALGDDEFFKGTSILEIWSLATGKRVLASNDLKGDIECLAVAPNNGRVMASLSRRQLQVFAMPDREGAAAPPAPMPAGCADQGSR